MDYYDNIRFNSFNINWFLMCAIQGINILQMATAEAELERMEAKLKNETGVAMAQRDFDIRKGGIKFSFTDFLSALIDDLW